MIKSNNLNRQKGFTVIEVLVSVFLFTVLAVIVSGIFVRTLQIERRAFSAQAIQEGITAVLELMTREIRVSRIENQNNNCSSDPIKSSLTVIHPDTGSITYSVVGGIVQRVVGASTYFLSYNETIFNTLRFCVTGSTLPSDDQPAKITIIASVSSGSGSNMVTINFQTTVTSRNIANEF